MNDWAIYLGLAIVIATHLWMLKSIMPKPMQTYHAFANLLGAALIIYGVYFTSPTPK